MMRRALMIWLIGLGAASAVLYQVKYEVRRLEVELAGLNRAYEQERESVQVLEAEWAYLNRPERIARLADAHLGMVPTPVSALSDLSALPTRRERLREAAASALDESPVVDEAPR